MPDNVVVLALHRTRTVRDLVKAEPVVGGLVALTIVDHEGDPVEALLTVTEAAGLLEDMATAIDAARHLLRVEHEQPDKPGADRA